MAESTIGSLPAVTDIYDSDKFALEQNGEAKCLLGNLLRRYINRNILSITVHQVSSTTPAGVKSYDSRSGELELNIPQGVGISSVEPIAPDPDAPAGPARLMKTYRVTREDGTYYDMIFYDGRGIQSIQKTAGDTSPGSIDTYTIYFNDGTTSQFYVYNGRDGQGQVNTVDGVQSDANLNIALGAMRLNASVGLDTMSGVDLDTRVSGVVMVDGATCQHSPYSDVFMLVCSGNGTIKTQLAVSKNNSRPVMTRTFANNAWSSWTYFATTRVVSVTLPAANWVQNSNYNYYSQTVAVSGITPNTRVDVQLTPEQMIDLFNNNTVGIVATNDNGTVEFHAARYAPSSDIAVQVTLTEVIT